MAYRDRHLCARKCAMTLDRYKFLCALLVLGEEFTVEDVIRFAKLPKTTVATFLNRESRFVERVGSIRTGRRGGQIAQYRVRPDQLGSLEREADQLQPNTVSATKGTESNLAATLIVADDTINRLSGNMSSEERAKMTGVAAFLISDAEHGVAALDSGSEGDAIRQRFAVVKQRFGAHLSPTPGVEHERNKAASSSRRSTKDNSEASGWRGSSAPLTKNETVNQS